MGASEPQRGRHDLFVGMRLGLVETLDRSARPRYGCDVGKHTSKVISYLFSEFPRQHRVHFGVGRFWNFRLRHGEDCSFAHSTISDRCDGSSFFYEERKTLKHSVRSWLRLA